MSTKNYDREFKINAVKLYRESQKPTSKICKELEIPTSSLIDRVKEFDLGYYCPAEYEKLMDRQQCLDF